MKRAVAVLALVGALATPAALASPARAPSPKAATAALGRLLHQLYGAGTRGYWTCPGPAVLGRVDCLAEVGAGSQWHQVSASATHSNGVIWINRVSAETWTRHWSPYSRHFILRSDEAQVPGVVSVNSPAYDWGWLAGCAGTVHAGRARRCDALDGDVNGVTRFYFFACSRRAGLITCRNALGDAMRYRPHG